jgi:hypothetical protein
MDHVRALPMSAGSRRFAALRLTAAHCWTLQLTLALCQKFDNGYLSRELSFARNPPHSHTSPRNIGLRLRPALLSPE